MKKLDRYIVKRFLGTFFFMLILLMSIAIVLDVSEKLDQFLRKSAPLESILLDYYVNFVLYYSNLFSALIVFLSVLLFTAKMARDTEIVPILSSGVSFRRFLLPYFYASTFLVVVSLLANHFLIPDANKKRMIFENAYNSTHFNVQNVHEERDDGRMIYFKLYVDTRDYIDDFWVTQRNPKTHRIESILHADMAYGDSITNNWRLQGYFLREFPDKKMDHVFHNKAIQDTTFDFNMKLFTATPELAATLPTPQLIRFIDQQKKKGSSDIAFYQVELHQRTSYPLATYILTLLGVSIASRKSRDSLGLNLAIGIALALVYIFCIKITTVAALKVGFPAFWAVWTPNIIFLLISLYVYRKTPK